MNWVKNEVFGIMGHRFEHLGQKFLNFSDLLVIFQQTSKYFEFFLNKQTNSQVQAIWQTKLKAKSQSPWKFCPAKVRE